VEPDKLRFGGGSAETAIHPVVAVAVVIACLLILLLPRKRIYIPFLLAAFLIPFGEVVVVGGVHFITLRIIILFGLIRMAFDKSKSKRRALAGGFNPIDKAVTLWALSYAVAFVLLYLEWPAVINRLGFLLDSLGGYFLVRYLIRDIEDVHRIIKLFAIIAFVLALCMLNEQATHHNIFGLIGGERSVPELRNGRIRSQAAFHHPLLAGAFGATLMPLLIAIWKGNKKIVIIGLIASVVMTIAAAESTSLLTLIAGGVGLGLWYVRKQMRAIRWAIVIILVGLHLSMKAPVWALLARIDVTGSSTSYDRFILVDNFIRHFGDWWLLGAKDYNNWGLDMWDLCNQYVAYGQTGGLAALIFFVAIIVMGFRSLLKARRRASGDRRQEWFLWCLWAALFSHVVGYFGLGYGDQMEIAWFALLSMIPVAALSVARPSLAGSESSPDTALSREKVLAGLSTIDTVEALELETRLPDASPRRIWI
jgi:hypothetical protein